MSELVHNKMCISIILYTFLFTKLTRILLAQNYFGFHMERASNALPLQP
jgi:hypothetical protein